MDEDVRMFLSKHGLDVNTDYCNYHMTLGLYYIYTRDALQSAEMIVNGEKFDEVEVTVILQQLYSARKTLTYYQNLLQLETGQFEISETIKFSESSLEGGYITGNVQEAVGIAKNWLRKFLDKYDRFRQEAEEPIEKSASQIFFLYEVAAYILYITDTELNYDFLEFRSGRKEKNRNK